jgi:hypothetical protein
MQSIVSTQDQALNSNLHVALLHDQMVDKTGKLVTTSVTLIDVHDIARSCKTYGVANFFVAHPSQTMRALVRTVKEHWDGEFGSTYNPNRQDALGILSIVTDLDEAILQVERRTGKIPRLVATSARDGAGRLPYHEFRSVLESSDDQYLLLFGTGWGMSDILLSRTQIILRPIYGPGTYNHLSVRAACAISLDRLKGR